MGFIYHAVQLPKYVTSAFFCTVLAHSTYLVTWILTHLGLYKPSPEEDGEESISTRDYMLILDSSSPSLVPVPIDAVIAAIKSGLPIVQHRGLEILGEGEDLCSICFDCVELNREVRELGNCGHLFHRECLDSWVDEGQITCPLCRAALIAPKSILSYRMQAIS